MSEMNDGIGRQRLCVLGATGSVGMATLEVAGLHPERFEIFEGKGGREARLPPLPEFRINLYAPPGLSPAARDLADHVRASFAGRAHRLHNN